VYKPLISRLFLTVNLFYFFFKPEEFQISWPAAASAFLIIIIIKSSESPLAVWLWIYQRERERRKETGEGQAGSTKTPSVEWIRHLFQIRREIQIVCGMQGRRYNLERGFFKNKHKVQKLTILMWKKLIWRLKNSFYKKKEKEIITIMRSEPATF